MKRVIDFLISLFGLIFLSPVLLVISILIKSTSSGGVFFIQERVGMNSIIFKMIKA